MCKSLIQKEKSSPLAAVEPSQVTANEPSPAIETVTIPAGFEGKRVDAALAELLTDLSRSRIQTLLRATKILVDGQPARPANKLTGLETILVNREPQMQENWSAQAIPLQIVYADKDIIVVDKQAGLVVHPGAGNPDGTMVNALLSAYPDLINLPRAGIVHRLDKDTTGLMVVARSELAHRTLVRALSERDVRRQYIALVRGTPISGGQVEASIGRDRKQRTRMAVVSDGRYAVTHYQIAERYEGYTLLDVQLETGRTHQIRVHMAHIAMPLVGDPVYAGRPRPLAKLAATLREHIGEFPRQALHAAQLSFLHPRSGERCSFTAPLPADMQQLLGALRENADATPKTPG